jgi:hypothetical protein
LLISEEPAHETYRVIVLGRNGSEILLRPSEAGLHFPHVTIPRWQRVAENVAIAMKKQWGHGVVCLFEMDSPLDGRNTSPHVVASYWRTSGNCAAPLQWISVNYLGEDSFAEPVDYSAVQRSLRQSSTGDRDPGIGPFARLSWFQKLCEWIGAVIMPRGLHLNGNFRQLNASTTFSLVRFETDGPAVWFKAVGHPNEREFPITFKLARLFPDYIPEILATRPEWNGWLMSEAEGTNLEETTNPLFWETAAAVLANLQIDSIPCLRELADCGAYDLKVSTLRSLVSPFMDAAAGLMKRQSKTPPPVLSKVELGILNETIQEALSVLEGLGLPDSLGHLDLNPANLIATPKRCVFLDWAEAYGGHPFFTFQYLLEHLRRTGTDCVSEQRLISSYFGPWEQVASPNRVAEAAALAPLLAAFAYAAGTGIWTQLERLNEPNTAGYLRSLVRRMNEEAHRLNERRSLCLS